MLDADADWAGVELRPIAQMSSHARERGHFVYNVKKSGQGRPIIVRLFRRQTSFFNLPLENFPVIVVDELKTLSQ